MSQIDPESVTFQVTVAQLSVTSQLSQQDIRVTVGVGGISKITCSGDISEDGLTVKWNHPFLFTAPTSSIVRVTICILPEQLTLDWDKQPLGDQMATDVSSLLECTNGWKSSVPGLSPSSGTLVMLCKAANTLTVPDGHDCQLALRKYDVVLFSLVQEFKNAACMSTIIELELAQLDLCPLGHPDHITTLNNYASSLLTCYAQDGHISDLNRAMEMCKTSLNLCSLGDPDFVDALGWFGTCLWDYYYIRKNEADLNIVIAVHERWLELCPSDHRGHAPAVGDLALALVERYHMRRNVADLDKAIELGEKRLELCPPSNSQHACALGNLATFLHTRYEAYGNPDDLYKAIEHQEQQLELCPPGHQIHGIALRNLALLLRCLYMKEKNPLYLIRIIDLLGDGLSIYPTQHRYYAFNASQLAQATIYLSKTLSSSGPSEESALLLNDAFETFRLLKMCSPAVSLDLLESTQSWIHNAEAYDHSSVLEAYQTALDTLDHFTSFTSSLDSRHETMQARVADIANDAFSCAIRHGNPQMAVELLEQGRGILWTQLARFDISLVTLERQGDRGRALGDTFRKLSSDLREHAQEGKTTEPYWQVHEQWQAVVDEIRSLDGFSRFLLPPRFEDLQQAAEDGPVIVVNASQYACDALIVLRTGPPVHVLLSCSFADVGRLCSQLSELTQDPHAYADNRESWVKQMLRDLWSSVVEPIVTALQNDVQWPLGARIWWCPTSTFTMLPFHAAGPYRKRKKNLADIYVSSYAPSLSALMRARDRVRFQREARDASDSADVISFAAIGQGRPSADAKLGQLPEVDHEIRKIRDDTDMPADVHFKTITGDAATVEGAVQAFRDHRWIHVACHGAQHAERPFESWFAMRDGHLTLMRILQERYTESEFAFLSACHTALGDASTPDEVLHLAAGMQFAGFNGVIGTLWRVDDAVAHEVATRFYKEMFKQPAVSFEHAATALNTAVVETTNELSLEKRIVFVHIGI